MSPGGMGRVCVHGLGRIGLPTAALLARHGHRVTGCDTDPAVAAAVNRGEAPFREEGLAELLAEAVRTGRLHAQSRAAEAECHILAVPTPCGAGRRPDLACLDAATDALAPLLRPGDLVILESTVPVGATETLAARLAAARPDLPPPGTMGGIALAHCPERVLPGRMLAELVGNDRIIGGLTPRCARRALAFYQGFVTGNCHLTDSRTAEFAKLAENTFRDVNIAFANELALLAEGLGVDAWEAIGLANRHPRVEILRPGPGVGGHCIAVDPWFLAHAAPDSAALIRAARAVNDARPGQVVHRLLTMAEAFPTPVLACFGLAYKPEVDDLRNSPALEIVASLARYPGLRLLVVEPYLDALPPPLRGLPNLALTEAAAALEQADILAFLVGHGAFRALVRQGLPAKPVLDAVGLLR